jgi:D-glycero-alpha-D-manno-heptose-7-phosphate kinase
MLYVTRTPLRVSLFGGGTDYREYFERSKGAVVGFTINKYIHIGVIKLTAYQEYNYRVAYSKLEFAQEVSQISHPVVREVLRHYDCRDRLDISVMSDLPASGGGLGSSSAFTVGFLNVVNAMRGQPTTRIDLAHSAIFVERELLKENVGVQDQLHASFGGINRFDFTKNRYTISPAQITGETMALLNRSMALVYTGIARRATTTVQAQIDATRGKKLDRQLSDLYAQVGVAVDLLESGGKDLLQTLGAMLDEAWRIKRGLTGSISNSDIDTLYDTIKRAGAHGAKLCGAGGGGYFLALIDPERLDALRAAVAPLPVLPVSIDTMGSSVIYPDQQN